MTRVLGQDWEHSLRRLLKLVLAVSLVLVVLELGFHLIAAPTLRLARVYVSGDDRGLSNQALLSLMGLSSREYYFSISDSEVEKRLAQVPWIRSARVFKVFPDTLHVEIQPRVPLALIMTKLEGRQLLLSVDSQGVVFDVNSQDAGRNLPILSVISFQALQPGMKLPDTLSSLFQSLARLDQQSHGLFAQISEIRVRRTDGGGFETILYPVQGTVRVILPEAWNDNLLQQAFVLLDVIQKQGWDSKTKEIDFRTTPVVVKSRES